MKRGKFIILNIGLLQIMGFELKLFKLIISPKYKLLSMGIFDFYLKSGKPVYLLGIELNRELDKYYFDILYFSILIKGKKYIGK